MRKHSGNIAKKFPLLLAAATLSILLLIPVVASAQMFSVENDGRVYRPPGTMISFGVELADFEYTGVELESQPDPGIYEFTGSLLRLEADTRNINIYLTGGGSFTGIEDISYFQAGIKGRYSFIMMGRDHFTLSAPARIQSDIVTVTNNQIFNSNRQFQQGSLLFGLGLNLEIRPRPDIRLQMKGVPHLGIAFSSGGTFGGNISSVDSGARLYYDRIFGDFGGMVGYSYKMRSYDIDLDDFDYTMNGHSIMIGVTF